MLYNSMENWSYFVNIVILIWIILHITWADGMNLCVFACVEKRKVCVCVCVYLWLSACANTSQRDKLSNSYGANSRGVINIIWSEEMCFLTAATRINEINCTLMTQSLLYYSLRWDTRTA